MSKAGNPEKFPLDALETFEDKEKSNFEQSKPRNQKAVKGVDKKQDEKGEVSEQVEQDGKVFVEAASDKLSASMRVIPPCGGGKPVNYEQACDALSKAGVVFGIDENAVNRAVLIADENENVTIARGLPPESGRDAVITYYFEPGGIPARPCEKEDGLVDYYNLGIIQNVKEGQLLTAKTLPTEGKPGMAVSGQAIKPRPGKDKLLLPGENTTLGQDNLTILAIKRGHVVLKNCRIHVLPVYECKDVDFSTGNIEFYGSVIVRGGVKPGFQVKAEGDVEIYGTVEGSTIISGANVSIKQGLINRSQVKAGGNVFVKFAQSSSIQAGNNVLVQQEIRQSSVDADNIIQVKGKKGLIVGGVCRAGGMLEAKVVGSSWGTQTQLEVGVAPSLRSDYLRVKEDLEKCIESFKKVSKATGFLRKIAVQRGGRLPRDKQLLSIRLNKTETKLVEEKEALQIKYQELEERMQCYKGQGVIKISNLVRTGVSVVVGQAKMTFKEDWGPVRLMEKDGEVKIETY